PAAPRAARLQVDRSHVPRLLPRLRAQSRGVADPAEPEGVARVTLAGGSREGEARSIFVVTAPGLERVAARELLDLGISGEVQAGGVEVRCGRSTLYDLNLRLRSASRVLVRIAEF